MMVINFYLAMRSSPFKEHSEDKAIYDALSNPQVCPLLHYPNNIFKIISVRFIDFSALNPSTDKW
jgi:hypothetical protein